MPKYQGELDGLCGPYAIANALEACGLKGHYEAMFQTACEALARSRWPALLWDGTGYGDLQRMIRACLSSPHNSKAVTVSYPFQHKPPSTNRDYWTQFDALFAEPAVRCAIIGLTQPRAHWVVVTRDSGDGGRLRFTDSDARNPGPRKNRTSLFAGERRQRPTQWLIDRKELAVFSVEG
jgi:hypothetical protein